MVLAKRNGGSITAGGGSDHGDSAGQRFRRDRTANATLALLRQVALDEKATTTRRLAAIDSLAALGNLHSQAYGILLTSYVRTDGARPALLTKALRRLLKARKFLSRGQDPLCTRLLFPEGVELGSGHGISTPTTGVPSRP